jgi:hypothetical protein
VIDPASFYREFEKVKDERKAKGKRSPLPFLLTVLLLGKLAGEKSINGRVDWVKERKSLRHAATRAGPKGFQSIRPLVRPWLIVTGKRSHKP